MKFFEMSNLSTSWMYVTKCACKKAIYYNFRCHPRLFFYYACIILNSYVLDWLRYFLFSYLYFWLSATRGEIKLST